MFDEGHSPGPPTGLGPLSSLSAPPMWTMPRLLWSDRAAPSPSYPLTVLCDLGCRICPTRTDTGTRPVSTARDARARWWTSPLPPRGTSCSARTATPTSTHPSAKNARRPSCQVRNNAPFSPLISSLLLAASVFVWLFWQICIVSSWLRALGKWWGVRRVIELRGHLVFFSCGVYVLNR